jgi:hypothetical protein
LSPKRRRSQGSQGEMGPRLFQLIHYIIAKGMGVYL